MAYRIPEEKIEEVKSACDIFDVVSESVVLKKSGRNYLGLCPFHSEKTPSFTVSPDKQIFHCFGCGEGGNVLTFVMKHKGLSFPEAVSMLAERHGIELPRPTGQDRGQPSLREQLLAANRAAMEWFRSNLSGTGFGRQATDYLARRGVGPETVERFHLGCAPNEWEALTRHLARRGIAPGVCEAAGLSVRRKSGSGHYDRFRARIVFPITDLSGRVLGFGGRVMDDAMPKYLNSPETPLYNKRRTLYALREARQDCRAEQTVYIVEGYFDAIAMHAFGIRNTVATLGTALTTEQVRSLKGFLGSGGRAVLVYDSDDAGIKAAQRCIDVFTREFVDARILVLADGHDPDSFLRRFGRDRLLAEAEEALGMTSFLLETAIGRHGLEPEGRIRILSEIVPAVQSIQDPVDRGVVVREVAERLQMDEAAVLEKARRHERPLGRQPSGNGVEEPGPPLDRTEAKIVSMMLQFPDMLEEVRRLGVVELLSHPGLAGIARAVLDRASSGGVRVAELMDDTPEPEAKRLIATLAMGEEEWNREGSLKLLTYFVENTRHRQRMTVLERQIAEAEKRGDEDSLVRLLTERQRLAASVGRHRRGG